MDSLALRLRQAARDALPPKAFLRRDRAGALFVSDAPRLRPDADWPRALARAGFECVVEGGLLRLYPGPKWLATLEAEYPESPDALSASLRHFYRLPPDGESLRLFALATQILDGERDDGRFERMLRQRAAECLRLNGMNGKIKSGGGLYACALARYRIEEAKI